MVLGALSPATARAGVIGDFVAAILHAPEKQREASSGGGNLQTMALPKPAMNANPTAGRGGGDIVIVDDSALMPAEGPSGTIADLEKPKNSKISVYVVREGDTLNGIAKLFQVSPNTILWANDMPRGSVLRIGQRLTILPVTGVKYTVKKGDTLASIAKKFKGDATEIATFNDIDDANLVVGTDILIPDGEIAVAPASVKKNSAGTSPVLSSGPKGSAAEIGYYMIPLARYVKTQGVHGYNGVDLAAPIGTPILASAGGEVMVAKQGGWNGGYGNYVVIQHGNGSQTLYAHQSKVAVSPGQQVERGEVIGYVGSTGKSTGSHLHFEIRNGIRNPF
ncbi:hypothetical protein A3C18_02945 [Candidatus Kaiserbacteria bacterium RIFCSPHIGHO2_02_FULL_54_11b]|uniref:LysM domain-containing protein n=1 Tax=Candidatus Kaiserbacteria bacterium RIFCSPHIGHO2_02_FULL_54_11b TaxID=1798494 RepID=A0A1F6DS50_9BACT|nr:MAG: hypothetical protein A3C18_02945 [Candidatus Kaiserbacteria bacterium RIFCSPHIGHO2_02_FULL_54_11b]